MSSHVAEIGWMSDGEFVSGRYSRRHSWSFDGGAVVHGSSSPQVVPEPMSDAAAVDPEEALVAAVASCHMLWFLSLAQAEGLDILSYSDKAEGQMGRIAGRQPDSAELDRLHHQAHERCFIANSLTSEIIVEPSASA